MTCVSSDGATQVHVRQADGAAPLAVDLGRLPEHISGDTAAPEAADGQGDDAPAVPVGRTDSASADALGILRSRGYLAVDRSG